MGLDKRIGIGGWVFFGFGLVMGGFVERGGDDWDWDRDFGLWLDGFMGCEWRTGGYREVGDRFFWGSGLIIDFFILGVCTHGLWSLISGFRYEDMNIWTLLLKSRFIP